jgi:hypothetical protein
MGKIYHDRLFQQPVLQRLFAPVADLRTVLVNALDQPTLAGCYIISFRLQLLFTTLGNGIDQRLLGKRGPGHKFNDTDHHRIYHNAYQNFLLF